MPDHPIEWYEIDTDTDPDTNFLPEEEMPPEPPPIPDPPLRGHNMRLGAAGGKICK